MSHIGELETPGLKSLMPAWSQLVPVTAAPDLAPQSSAEDTRVIKVPELRGTQTFGTIGC